MAATLGGAVVVQELQISTTHLDPVAVVPAQANAAAAAAELQIQTTACLAATATNPARDPLEEKSTGAAAVAPALAMAEVAMQTKAAGRQAHHATEVRTLAERAEATAAMPTGAGATPMVLLVVAVAALVRQAKLDMPNSSFKRSHATLPQSFSII